MYDRLVTYKIHPVWVIAFLFSFQVNTVSWSEDGQYILSGSDDKRLVVSEPFTGKVNYCLEKRL